MEYSNLPTLNAFLNFLSSVFLVIGFIRIKNNDREGHKRFMLLALITSGLFLISYLIYHEKVGSVPYPYMDWTRPIYFVILIPHVILAAVMVPFIVMAVRYAWKENFLKHTNITRWLWWVWMFVSVSGVMIYLMLYRPL